MKGRIPKKTDKHCTLMYIYLIKDNLEYKIYDY